ncbi:ankyrin repeat domain-containing protein [Flavobacterium sp.]|uniref:ankyrin repeat domain-containing protein n=1 Tax=Flavobacterium sp. TaxID=239 RepID=UPI003752CD8C
MKKSIVYLSLALVLLSNATFASGVKSFQKIENAFFEATPLCNAIVNGDFETVKKFIEYGAGVNEFSNGVSPLMLAARYNHVEIIKFLLVKGADVNAKDERGYNAYKYAEMSKATEALLLLKK